jgi:AraC family transcriptional regulator, 4-hydroxyphenylacetate 3-monooxygenase operon regulatory protein
MLLPIYQECGKTYAPDTCAPLVEGVKEGKIRLQALARGHYPGVKLARNALAGVKSLGFWDADRPQDWGLDWHRNEGVELTFLESGSMHFGVDNHEFQLQPNDLTFTRPWQQHRLGKPHIGPGRLHFLILDVGVRRPHQRWRWPSWLVLTSADLRQLTIYMRQIEQPVWPAGPEIRRCYQQLAQAVEGENISRLAVFLNELFILVLDMFRREKVALDESLSSARRTVELFWNDLQSGDEQLGLEWSIVAMARRCGMGVTHFIHQTKQLVNMTPSHYLTRCRLEAAAILLREQSDANITEIAMRFGFSSSQYFATQFRRQFGRTPSDYRLS